MNLNWSEFWSDLAPSIDRLADQIKALEECAKNPQQRALLSIIREIMARKESISLNYILEKIEIAFGCSIVTKQSLEGTQKTVGESLDKQP
jgi:hypothetical protein